MFYNHVWTQNSQIQFLCYFYSPFPGSTLLQDHITNTSLWPSLAEHCHFCLLFCWPGFIFHVTVLQQVTVSLWLPALGETSLPTQLPSHQPCLPLLFHWWIFLFCLSYACNDFLHFLEVMYKMIRVGLCYKPRKYSWVSSTVFPLLPPSKLWPQIHVLHLCPSLPAK